MPNKTHARDLFVNFNIDAKEKAWNNVVWFLKFKKNHPFHIVICFTIKELLLPVL
jgi:hypothetical protein